MIRAVDALLAGFREFVRDDVNAHLIGAVLAAFARWAKAQPKAYAALRYIIMSVREALLCPRNDADTRLARDFAVTLSDMVLRRLLVPAARTTSVTRLKRTRAKDESDDEASSNDGRDGRRPAPIYAS